MNLQRQRNRFALYVLRIATSFLIALHSNVYRKPVGKRSAVASILFFCHSVFLRSDFARANKNRLLHSSKDIESPFNFTVLMAELHIRPVI